MAKTSVDEILDFAIAEELSANRFYTQLAAKMENEAMRKVLEDFAQEELGHKATLEGIKQGQAVEASEVADLKIADYLVDVEPRGDMDYQDALVLAMKSEEAAFKLYSELAANCQDQSLRETFSLLAQQEAKHKHRFEVEYDDVILKEN